MRAKDARNLIAGFLWTFGGLAFLVGMYLNYSWAVAAPQAADPEHGLIYLRNVNDHAGYWSAFQITSNALLSYYTIPLAMLGVVVMPRKNERYRSKGPVFDLTWTRDDPRQLQTWGAAAGAAFTALLFWRLGPALVEALNVHAIVLNY